LPVSAAKVWQQLGLGSLEDAARQAFLTNLGWGGLRAGTRFNDPAPLFPRAEKDTIERMQNLEDQNNSSAVEAAAETGKDSAPSQATASPSVGSVDGPATAPGEAGAAGEPGDDQMTSTTTAPMNSEQPVETAHVHQVPAELAGSRLSSTPMEAPKGAPLHPEEKKPENPPEAPPQPAHITIDDFAKVELRVAQVLVAERIPKADKLLRLEVDLGYEKRQILAGIAEHYEPEKLIGRKIVIVANLAPRKMRGLESNGMLLAASLPDGAPVLAGFLEEVPLGARLK
jgi:methionyl-tRNA synthetase